MRTLDPYAKELYLCTNCEEPCTEDEKGIGYCRTCLPEKIVELADIYADMLDCGIVPSWSDTQFSALEGIVANAGRGHWYIGRAPERKGRAK